MKYRISNTKDPERFKKEIEDNFVSVDKDGNIIIDADIHCRDMYLEGDSLYIGGKKMLAPKADEDTYYLKYNHIKSKFEYAEIEDTSFDDGNNILANQVFS